MNTNNLNPDLSLGNWRIKVCLAQLAMVLALLAPQDSHAKKGVPMPECAKKLLSCASDAAQTVGQSVLTVGNILGHVVANPECVAAMASGSPAAIGVTGLVMGLGAAGVVNPHSCEASIYGTAIIPVSMALDAVLNSSLASQLQGASLDVAMNLMKPIPVPAVPPTLGGLIDCGCGALEAGAQAIEDVRKVAKFAAQTYESCSGAANSCPGLKEAVWVLKGAYQVITDPSSIVQSCDSMSRQQYVDARLRDLIPFVRDQFRDNIAWQGSNMQVNHWNPRLNTCYKYYDSHCYKEDDAKNFCVAAVWTEVFDPLVWGAIIEEYNGPQFDKFFSERLKQLAPPAVCPSDAGMSISLDPNALEQGKAARSANAKACQQEMAALLTGEKGSMKSLAREMLPTTREGWDADVRQKFTEKPLDNAKKVFLRVMTAASVVAKSKMAQASAKYAEQDTALAGSAEFAAAPYIVLNKNYGKWASIIARVIQDECPKDASGWNGKYDLTCVKELAISVGMSANEAATIKLDGNVVAMIDQSITSGSFKGSKYYNIASELILKGTVGSPTRIRPNPNTAEKEIAFFQNRWPQAEAAATLAFAADLPELIGKQFERVGQDKTKRKTQDDVFAALEKNNKIESDYAKDVCDKLKSGQIANALPIFCKNDIDKIVAEEASKFSVSRAGTFLNVPSSAKPGTDAAFNKSVADIKLAHADAVKKIAAIHKQFNLDTERVLMAGTTRSGGTPVKLVAPGVRAGAVAAAGGGIVKAALEAEKPPVTGARAYAGSLVNRLPEVATAPQVKALGMPALPSARPAKAVSSVGMPGLPGMSSTSLKDNKLLQGASIAAALEPQKSSPPVVKSLQDTKLGDTVVVAVMPKEVVTIPPPPTPPPTGGSASTPKAGSSIAPSGALASAAVTSGNNAAAAQAMEKFIPFDPVNYRKDRAAALYSPWLTKCANNNACMQTMAAILVKRIEAEVSSLTAGKPDHKDKPAVTAFQNSLDPIYDPQLQEAIPRVATSKPVTSGSISNQPVKNLKPSGIKP